MQACVGSARRAGIFKQFHVFTDRAIPECVCYDAMDFNAEAGLYQLLYLKAGMAKLNVDYFVWVDADTRFVRQPKNLLDVMGRSPIHLPLELKLGDADDSVQFDGITPSEYEHLMRRAGVLNDVYFGESAFWVVHHDAIDRVYELSTNLLANCKAEGRPQDATKALSFAMQALCGNPERHLCLHRRDLWAPVRDNPFCEVGVNGKPWLYRVPFTGRDELVHPAIVHLGRRRQEEGFAGGSREPEKAMLAPAQDANLSKALYA